MYGRFFRRFMLTVISSLHRSLPIYEVIESSLRNGDTRETSVAKVATVNVDLEAV